MKKGLLIILALFVVALAGCSTEASDNTDNSDTGETTTVEASEDGFTLTDYAGWWYMDESTLDSSNEYYYTQIYVDADTEEWYAYDDTGMQVDGGTAYIDTDYDLMLSMDSGDEIDLYFNDDYVLCVLGESTEYIYGTSDYEEQGSEYEGIWYEFGIEGDDYVVINSDGTYEIYNDGVVNESGTYSFSYDSATAKSQMILDDGSADSYIIVNDEGLLDNNDVSIYYIKDSVLGTDEGNMVDIYCSMILYTWYCSDTDNYLQFNTSDEVFEMIQNSDGDLETYWQGTFEFEDGNITITWENGDFDSVQYINSYSFSLPTTDEVFEMY